MTTATITNASASEKSREISRSIFQVYKPGEGYATRLGMMVVIMAYVGFACHHWFYNWVFVRDFFDGIFSAIHLGFLTAWTYNVVCSRWIAAAGALIVASVGLLIGYYFIYLKHNTAEFLIKTDSELGKVNWPKITPWFKPNTQVWGATYVVLIVIAALTIYVFGIDFILQHGSKYLFYK